NRCLHIVHKGKKPIEGAPTGVVVGDWLYVQGEGFYGRKIDPILSSDLISEEKIGSILSQSGKILENFLPIFPKKRSAQYQLHFDNSANLHIELYVLEPGDLSSSRAHCFAPWVYLPDRGFYLIEELKFEGKE